MRPITTPRVSAIKDRRRQAHPGATTRVTLTPQEAKLLEAIRNTPQIYYAAIHNATAAWLAEHCGEAQDQETAYLIDKAHELSQMLSEIANPKLSRITLGMQFPKLKIA